MSGQIDTQWPNPNCPFGPLPPGEITPPCPNPGVLYAPPLFSSGPPGGPGVNGVNNGLVCLSGTGAPSNTLGADGDLYVDTAAHALYGPKTAGVWGAAIGGTSGAAGGDLTGTYPNPTLAVIGVGGTGTKFTVDTKGRVTAIGVLTAADIPGGVELTANKDHASGYAGLTAGTLLKTAEFPAFTGDITTTAGGVATVLSAGAVTNAKMANMATDTVKGNNTGISAAPQDITFAALATALSVAVTAVKTVKVQVFTGNGTYTPATGMLYCTVEVVGGGGGGGGALGVAAQSSAGGGGGGGGYARKTFASATVGASQTVTVGASANGGTAGTNNGTNGNTTSFGALLSATGGGAGTGGTSSATSPTGTGSGAGGVGSSGDFNANGEAGGTGLAFGASAAALGGRGGGSYFSGGVTGGAISGAGTAGTNYGVGGGGGASGTTSMAGGAGAQGIVIVTEFCSQ